MFIATAIVSVLLAALLTFSAIRKLSHEKQVVESYRKVGVPEDKLNYLALTLLAGAVGVVGGLAWAPLGAAAAVSLVCYFAVAVVAHVRAKDTSNLPTPLALAAIAALSLTLRLASM